MASLLNRFLGMYIRNFDPGQLKVGIWSGDVKLRNLELRKEALDQLKLPVNVVEGHLGELTLKIPWSNLRGQPVQVFVEDVFLLAAPKEDAEYDEEEEERRRQAIKIEKLDSAELLKDRNAEGMSQEEQQKNQSFTDSLVTKIVDNLQITIKNIHVRYEDSISAPGHPFGLGITLDEISAVSTDGQWKPTYIQNSKGPTHKLATMSALAIYWNTDITLLSTGRQAEVPGADVASHEQILAEFKKMIVKGEDPNATGHQFILKPVSGQARLELDKSGAINIPQIKTALEFDEIGIELDDDQYRDALMMIDLFHYFIRHQEYKKLQPKGVSANQDPRAWFKFAGNAIFSKIHERNRRWSWEYFKERRDDRIRYIQLFKKKKQSAEQMTAEEQKAIDALEWKLSYEDLRFWRSLARNQLRKENVGVKKTPAAPKNQGWVAWAFGSSQAANKQEEEKETELTDEQRKELYDAIDWDEKTALAASVDLPKDTVKLEVNASLNTGSFTLRRDPHGTAVEVLSLYFDDFEAKFLERPDNFVADIALGGLRLNDGTTPDTLFPQIIRVKDSPESSSQDISSKSDQDDGKEVAQPFFQLQFEKNPLDGASDLGLMAKLRPLEIIWNPQFVVGIAAFFRPPERHMDTIGALLESAGATVEGLRQQTRAGLEFALDEHKTINAKLDLQAPLIIVPEQITNKNTPCLILDAGHIRLTSELVDPGTIKEIHDKQRQAYTEDDYKMLESLMFDKFLVKLSDTQMLIGHSVEATKQQLIQRDERQSMHILERMNIDLTIETSIIPKAPNVTKVRVSGHLPVLHVSASDKKYKNLMKIIDIAVPNFNEPTSQDRQVLAGSSRPTTSASSKRRSSTFGNQPRIASFPFSQQEAIILNDSDDEREDPMQYQDAESGLDNEKLRIQQRNFELKFEVDRLQGSLYRSQPEGDKPEQLLAELVAQNFKIDLCVRPFDTIIQTSLASLALDDFIEDVPAEFKEIISSGDPEDNDLKKLVEINLVIVKRDSPEFMQKYNGVEVNIDVAVSTINLVVTRRTLLTLLDFILVTFTDNAPSAIQAAPENEGDDSDDSSEIVAPATGTNGPTNSVRIKVDLKSIRIILNNDGIRLATLSLTKADVGIYVSGNILRIRTKLGNLSLVDDINQGASQDSSLRKLITIEGDDLADFRYETFDTTSKDAYPGYDSSIYLRAGSIRVNFLEEPFRKILDFLVKFGKMQALFNAARQAAANQASNLQQNTARVKFDVNVKTPIVVFPRLMVAGRPKKDVLVANLGEIYAENKFVALDDKQDSPTAMHLSAGIRNIRLTSTIHYPDEQCEELEIINKVDLGFKITWTEHIQGSKRPDLEVEGHMTDFNLCISQTQLKFLLELSKSVPAAFILDADEPDEDDVPDIVLTRARTGSESKDDTTAQLVDLGPELGRSPESWTKVDLAFHVKTIGMELLLATEDRPVGELADASLSKFSIDDTKVKLRMVTDGSLESELLIQSFTIKDSRIHTSNKFRKIMTSSNKDVQQFMASITISAGQERNLIAIIAIDSPRVIFALDYLYAIQSFAEQGLKVDEPVSQVIEDDLSDSETSDGDSLQSAKPTKSINKAPIEPSKTESATESNMSVAFRLNVVDAQIIMIANPTIASSEAIVLGTKQILMSQQHAFTLQVSKMGMFLCRMDRFDAAQLRIIDDFSMLVSMDSSKIDATSIHIDVEPLILRLALRDILLALQIVRRASELSGQGEDGKDGTKASDQKVKQLKASSTDLQRRTPSGKAPSTMVSTSRAGRPTSSTQTQQANQPNPIKKSEELTASVDGIRVILIGDLYELPILDMSINSLVATAQDWSGQLHAETSVDMFVNVYNFSMSAWEPLIEPWHLGLQVHKVKEKDTECMSIELSSPKALELTVTSATIALASKAADFIAQDEDVLSKPRGSEAPYRMRNHTGFELEVWPESSRSDQKSVTKLADGEEAPWRFENWEKMRENLEPERGLGIIGLRLEASGFEPVTNIPVTQEGETIYSLRPRKDDVLHRLLVEVTLGVDNIKYITIRSPLLVENKTQIPVELGVFDEVEGHLLKIEKIAPGESRPAPVGASFIKSLLVRPDQGFGYAWNTEALFWKDLVRRPTKTLMCKNEGGDKAAPFYFQMHAVFDKNHALTRQVVLLGIENNMTLTLSIEYILT